ncbi:MAG: DUF489 family protein [Pseudomonadales bacterium]|nr:DUF489 family protein [Pseudomonadales bacterium]
MPDSALDYRSLALAGVVQAAALVQARAHGRDGPGLGAAAVAAVRHPIRSRHPENTAEIFPDPAALAPGVELAIELMSSKPKDLEILRYSLQLIDLAGRLKRHKAVLERLGRLLDDLPVDPLDSQYAAVYQGSISTLGQRIEVRGNPDLLRQETVANEIRTLLLGGVRFAWLWQQLGGRRWQLVLQRNGVLQALQSLAAALKDRTVIH